MISKTDVNNILAEKERRGEERRGECLVDPGNSAGRIRKVEIERENVENIKQVRWD